MNVPESVIFIVILTITSALITNAQSAACWYYWPNVNVNLGQGLLVKVMNGSYNLYVFTPTQYAKWSSGSGGYAVYAGSVTVGAYLVRIPPGSYYVVLYPTQCGSIVNAGINVIGLAPTGLSSIIPINTTAVLGYFNISIIRAWNASYTAVNVLRVPKSSASLQLNAVVRVELINGSFQEYWLQDALIFITSNGVFSVADNVWNATAPGANVSSSLITGLGRVYNAVGVSQEYYGYVGNLTRYQLPLSGYLEVNVTLINDSVVVMFGYAIVRNGSTYAPPVIKWFDNVTLGIKAKDALIVTTPYEETGGGYAYDVELVFGGGFNGEQTTFESLNAQLAVMHWSGSGWVPYSQVYNFGMNTGESATDLVTSISSNGNVQVTVGIPYYGELTNDFKPTIPTSFIEVIYPNSTVKGFYTFKETTVTLPRVIISNGVTYIFKGIDESCNGATRLIRNNSATVTPSINAFSTCVIRGNYSTYFLLRLKSQYPINITLVNGTFTVTNMESWLPANSSLVIRVKAIYPLSNLTRVKTINETLINMTVREPLNLTIEWIRQYFVRVMSIVPINVNGSLTLSYFNWINNGSVLELSIPSFMYFNNGSRLMALNKSRVIIVVTHPLNITTSWVRQYLVNISSIAPILINGNYSINYVQWINSGSIINVTVPKYYYLNGSVRLMALNSSILITVNNPIKATVKWVRQYLIEVNSIVPVMVNESQLTSLINWLNESSTLIINAQPQYYFNNGTRLILLNSSEIKVIINKPLNLTIEWVRQYLVNVTSSAPLMVNDTLVKSIQDWFNSSSLLNITLTIQYFNNGTRLLPLNSSLILIKVNKPLNLTVNWVRQYLVNLTSPIALNINGTVSRNYSRWINASDLIILNGPLRILEVNLTIIKLASVSINGQLHYSLPINLTVNEPLMIKVNWVRDYIVYYSLVLLVIVIVLILVASRRGG
ncbi:thermopsin family protease [Caldivirga maquilingensis]|uniref:Peptidase A5, thermopsin n=1 Tax=Caldivirga maquilingensis (strain ATCC 700844 / DSM 13496 / JCM 10307 / IC-167) TaxID=397948 RepID=A8ME39_CALMQ|nr:thermopsin family protease [Caldivirga maquilingensis]ABW02045.1 Peptidase A5, thermopsin [Caldivirga maquilingensis IC-167]